MTQHYPVPLTDNSSEWKLILEKMVDAGELGIKSKIGFYDYSLGIKEKTVNNRFL